MWWDRKCLSTAKTFKKICVYSLLTSSCMLVGWVSQKRSTVCFLKYKGSLSKRLVLPRTHKLYFFHYHCVVIDAKLTSLKGWFFNHFFLICKYFHPLLFLLITIFSPFWHLCFKLKQFLEISCICKHSPALGPTLGYL